jgi:hypothetical protein
VRELQARVAELEAKIRDLQVIHNDAYERSRPTELEELRAERDVLNARVAEMEPDAKLGRMVREMPEGAELAHVVMTSGRSYFTYAEPRPTWGLLSRCARNGDTPAEAMQEVRSKP